MIGNFENLYKLSLAIILSANVIVAQERFGEIQGTVTDATGAVVLSAAVTLTEVQSSRITTGRTGENGTYVFRAVEPGQYVIRFEREGFNTHEVPNVNVTASKVLTVNAKLEIGFAQESVQVTADAPFIDTTTPLVAQHLSAGEFHRLPKGRSFQSLAITSANVSSGVLEGGIQVNGASASENQFVVDGVSVTSVLQGQQRQNAAFELLQEVQVKTGGMEAQYGGATGGVITAISKSGGNAFHGDLHYYYFGNAISAGPPQRLLLDPANQIIVSYVQDHKNTNDTHEAGYSLGGRIVRNKLFFFSAASPQYNRREAAYWTADLPVPERFDATSRTRYMQAFNKVSFAPWRWLNGNLSWLYSPSRESGVLAPSDGNGNETTGSAEFLRANQQRGWSSPQSSYNASLTVLLSNTAMVQLHGGYLWDNYKTSGLSARSGIEWGNSSLPEAELSFGLPLELQRGFASRTLPRVQNVNHDLATRTTLQADFSKIVAGFGGFHDFKVGIGRMKNVSNVDVAFSGGGYVTLMWDASFRDDFRGRYGYYFVDDWGTSGSTGGTIDNIYVQDRWRPFRRLSIDLGLRLEKEVVPSFRRDLSDYAFTFGWDKKISPRFGASYDVLGDGRMKIYGSWGIFQNWIPLELSRAVFGGDYGHRHYRALDNLGDVLNLGNGNLPGANLWPSEFRDFRIPSFGSDQVDPNIKPMSTHLVNAGFEYQFSPSLVGAIRYTSNHLRNAIEDVGTLNAEGNEVFTYGNPGSGPVAKSVAYGSAGRVIDYPKPKRNYDSVEISVSRRFTRRWFGTVSYTYSRLYGNYSGLSSTDEVTPPSIGPTIPPSQQNDVQVTRPGTSASRYYDLPYMLYDARGNVVEGRLATDRPHALRLYGSYLLPFGIEIGAFFYGASGTPVTTNVNTQDNASIMVNGRVDMGRTPFLNRTDLVIAHEIQKFGEGRRLRLEFNAQNLFNQKIATYTFNNYNRYASETSAVTVQSVNFTKPYDWKQLVAATEDASRPRGALDPRYGRNEMFTPGFSGRFGIKFIF